MGPHYTAREDENTNLISGTTNWGRSMQYVEDKFLIEREQFSDDWEEWFKQIKNSNLHKLLQERLKELEPDRGSDCIQTLKGSILAYCFCCSEFSNVPGSGWTFLLREEDRGFVKSAEKALQNIQQLLSFMKEQPPSHEALNKTLNIDLESILSHYAINVKTLVKEMGGKRFAHWRQHGALLFPRGLSNQSQRGTPQTNSLLFSLVFILRQYTDPNSPDSAWLKVKAGPMPKIGRPHYGLVAQIINATNELCIPPVFETAMTEGQVKKRITRLTEKDVELSTWIAPSRTSAADHDRLKLK